MTDFTKKNARTCKFYNAANEEWISAKTKVLTKGYKQESADRADFYVYSTVFRADSHGAIGFS